MQNMSSVRNPKKRVKSNSKLFSNCNWKFIVTIIAENNSFLFSRSKRSGVSFFTRTLWLMFSLGNVMQNCRTMSFYLFAPCTPLFKQIYICSPFKNDFLINLHTCLSICISKNTALGISNARLTFAGTFGRNSQALKWKQADCSQTVGNVE